MCPSTLTIVLSSSTDFPTGFFKIFLAKFSVSSCLNNSFTCCYFTGQQQTVSQGRINPQSSRDSQLAFHRFPTCSCAIHTYKTSRHNQLSENCLNYLLACCFSTGLPANLSGQNKPLSTKIPSLVPARSCTNKNFPSRFSAAFGTDPFYLDLLPSVYF